MDNNKCNGVTLNQSTSISSNSERWKTKGFGVNGDINRHLEFRAHMYTFKLCLL